VANAWQGPSGISITDALLIEVVTGTGLSTAVEGVVYLGGAD
jgi:hypothetical protein